MFRYDLGSASDKAPGRVQEETSEQALQIEAAQEFKAQLQQLQDTIKKQVLSNLLLANPHHPPQPAALPDISGPL